jgi:FkbM family methyltransferase
MMLALAGELNRRLPEAALLALTGSNRAGSYQLPPNLELVKLPSVAASPLLADLRPARGSGYTRRGLWALREALIHETMRVFDPHLVIADNLPAGLLGEFKRGLGAIAGRTPGAAIVLMLTDVPNEPATLGNEWDETIDVRRLAEVYDRVIVFGDRVVFDPAVECGFPEVIAGRTRFCGYIGPGEPAVPAEAIRARLGVGNGQLVVVTVGGGENGSALLDAYLTAMGRSNLRLDGVRSLVVAGPFLEARMRERLAAMAASLPAVTFVSFLDDLPSYLDAADAVVTMGGYNGVVEAVGRRKPTIVVPHDDALGEQRLRAEHFAALGLVTTILPSDLTAERLGRAVREALDSQVSPPAVLDFDGLKRAGALMVELLEERTALWGARMLRAGSEVTAPNVRRPMEDETIQTATTWDGTRFYTDDRNLIERDILMKGGFEIELQKEMAALVFPGDMVLDCGANIGVHACSLGRRVGVDGRVIAVEPVPALADRLEANGRLNGLENLTVVRKAVSSVRGSVPFYAPAPESWNQGGGSFHVNRAPAQSSIMVETVTIDELVEEYGVRTLRVLKLDIEGHEFEALLGASAVLRHMRPHVFFEFHPELWAAAGRSLAEATRLLTNEFDYRIRPIGEEPEGIRMIGAMPI